MTTPRLLPIVVLLVATLGMGQAPPGGSRLDATPVVESDGVHPGTTVRVALQVNVAEHFHIQSNQPRDPSLIPTTLTIDPPTGVSVDEIVFPTPTDAYLKGNPEPLAVFDGSVVVGVRLAIGKAQPPGEITVPARLRYQACDENVCYRPVVLDISWALRVVPPSVKTTARHQDVFSRVAFGRGSAPLPGAATPAPGRAAPSAAAAPTQLPSAPPSATSATANVVALFDRFTIRGNSVGGYMNAKEFLQFIHNAEAGVKAKGLFDGRAPMAIVAIVFLGGLALNLTPCVLPMIPINLAIIGAGARGSRRGRGLLLGAAYGGAMALVYGVLGVIVILTAGTFGTINASPWFNFGIAALFIVLGLAMFDIGSVDFSRFSSRIRFGDEARGTFLLAFSMGAVAALLAGACVAPVVIQVVVLASNLYAKGTSIALALPFVLGLGMALPWPIAGAGLGALPKPGAWMVRVKQAFGVFILGMAAYYGYVGYGILANRWVDPASVKASVDQQLKNGWHASLAEGLQVAERSQTPVIVDFWATWCKNCLTMDKTTLADPAVRAALAGYTRIKFQAEDPDQPPARELMQRIGAVGLPAYVILQPGPSPR